MEKLNPFYLTGLIEGEGSFCISFSFRKRLKIGIETRPSFSITLNKRDLDLLKKVHSYFECGGIRFSKGDRTYKYEVRIIRELAKKIIPHFDSFPLKGSKKKDFELFKSICLKIHRNEHLNGFYLKEIINDAYEINPSGKRKYTKQYLLKALTR